MQHILVQSMLSKQQSGISCSIMACFYQECLNVDSDGILGVGLVPARAQTLHVIQWIRCWSNNIWVFP